MIAAPISKNSIKRMRLYSVVLPLRLKGESRQQTNCPTYRSKNRSSADSFTETKIRFGYKKNQTALNVAHCGDGFRRCCRRASRGSNRRLRQLPDCAWRGATPCRVHVQGSAIDQT